jgi:hypothetical protein
MKRKVISHYWNDSMNLNVIKKCHEWKSQVKHECQQSNSTSLIKKWATETYKCYNCEVTEYLVRNCKKSYCERKEAAMNKRIVHN